MGFETRVNRQQWAFAFGVGDSTGKRAGSLSRNLTVVYMSYTAPE